MESQVLKIFLALVVLVNPFAALSLFIDITKDANRQQTRKVALISAITVFVTIAIFSLAGEPILKVLGISLGSFRIAGGILVLIIAIGMMNGAGNVAKPHVGKSGDLNGVAFQGAASAVVPLTIPMTRVMGSPRNDSRNARMSGIPPATAASNNRSTPAASDCAHSS